MSDVRREEDRIRRAYAVRRDAERYSALSAGQQMLLQSAERGILGALSRAGVRSLHDAAVLEIGCGSGHWLRSLIDWGARPERVTGVDLLGERLAEARTRCAQGVSLALASAASLPFRDATFDIVLQSTVLTSILDADVRRLVAGELLRVLKGDGVIVWYDFFVDNPRNRDVRGVRRGEIAELFPGCRADLRRTTLAPPLARAIAPRSWILASVLSALPFLRTHLAGSIRRQTA